MVNCSTDILKSLERSQKGYIWDNNYIELIETVIININKIENQKTKINIDKYKL